MKRYGTQKIYVTEDLNWGRFIVSGSIMMTIRAGYTDKQITKWVKWHFSKFTTFNERKKEEENNKLYCEKIL